MHPMFVEQQSGPLAHGLEKAINGEEKRIVRWILGSRF
jgi:hypothetical protein